jgi:hypothetical protein
MARKIDAPDPLSQLFDGGPRARAMLDSAKKNLRDHIAALEQQIVDSRSKLKFLEAFPGTGSGGRAAPPADEAKTSAKPGSGGKTARGRSATAPKRSKSGKLRKANRGKSSGMTVGQRRARRLGLIAVLRQLPSEKLARLTLDEAVKAVKKAKLDLGVSDEGLPISVSNMLLYSPKEFKKLDKGVFQYRGKK